MNFTDGSQQRLSHSGTLGARSRGVTGCESLRPWSVGKRDGRGESPHRRLTSGSKAKVGLLAPGVLFVKNFEATA